VFVKKISACNSFVANDDCTIRELLHPKNDAIDLPYSLALATVDVGSKSYQHKLEQTEVYHILQGHIPAEALQWIENIGSEPLIFAAIVSPPWTKDGDVRLYTRDT